MLTIIEIAKSIAFLIAWGASLGISARIIIAQIENGSIDTLYAVVLAVSSFLFGCMTYQIILWNI